MIKAYSTQIIPTTASSFDRRATVFTHGVHPYAALNVGYQQPDIAPHSGINISPDVYWNYPSGWNMPPINLQT